jgi:phage gp16-like protein
MPARSLTKQTPGRDAPARDERARLIRLVHVGRRELGLDDPSYRALLQAQAGVASASLASPKQLQRVVEAMKRAGFKVTAKPSEAPLQVAVKSRRTGVSAASAAVALASDPQSRKARAMWITLHQIGQVRDSSEQALLAYARRQTGVERLEWVPDMVPVLEPLKAWLLRSLPKVLATYVREPATAWAAHMEPPWHEAWQAAVLTLKAGLQARKKHLVDEYVDLWHLVMAAGARSGGA